MIDTFIIRLNGVESSELLAEDCKNSAVQHGLDPLYFDGIYGEKHIEEMNRTFNIRPWKEKMKKGRLGVKGCFLSHYSLWFKCYSYNKPLLIFEHDAFVLRSLPKNILHEFDEFLILDPYNKMKSSYKHNIETETKNGVEEYFNFESASKYGVNDQYAMGLQAYIIKPTAAKKLIHTVFKNGYLPADMQCNKGILNMQVLYPAVAAINPKFWGKKGLMREESTTQKKW